MMTIPTPYDPNVSPELALYVERCRVPVKVGYLPTYGNWYIGCYEPLYWRVRHNHADATDAYTQLRDRIMSERGQLTDMEA